MKKRDAHVHTKYCPHGTKDTFDEYVEKAIEQGLSSISFTEHAPLPSNFIDPTPEKDSGMRTNDLERYILDIQAIQKQYKNDIDIKCGLEVDYIEGYEKETQALLDHVGPYLDDSILSVHFLNCEGKWICLDYSPDSFKEASNILGGVNQVYDLYFQQVLKSVETDLGYFKPKRIGHMTLVTKFQKRFKPTKGFSSIKDTILENIADKGYALDWNSAGLRKPLCREMYPDLETIQKAKHLGIELVFGSDAHQAKEIGLGYETLTQILETLTE
ncbi:histidinol-phosphatase HisJ [Bacillus carboniphilus]|uniref:Histidinol-phosphatase n=1 Tax=Bacillus carboniphilus TaxID=86663 RepID=A0ABP3G3C8_9BACI